MALFDTADYDGHEHVSFFADERAGLRCIVAIHSTAPIGISGGGCRMQPYQDSQAALRDALRLSRAMSYKLALVGLPAGGAKAIILGDPARDKSAPLLRAFGRVVERLGGRFIAGEDAGTTPADMRIIGEETAYVVKGGADTARATAEGVVLAMEVAVARRLGRTLDRVRVLVQGAGRVGFHVARELKKRGAEVIVADRDPRAVERAVAELGVSSIAPADVFSADVDVLSPCALGDVLNAQSIPKLRCSVVVGSANNQLKEDADADALVARGILHCPDFVSSAGGVIGAALDGAGGSAAATAFLPRMSQLPELTSKVFELAEKSGKSPHAAALGLARERVAELRRSSR